MLETKKLKTALGGFMSFMSVTFSSVWLMAGVYQGSGLVQAFSPSPTQAVIETEKQDYFHDFRSVVPSMAGISQGFGRWHQGIDIMAPAGSEIYPVQKGKVLRTENTRWGYGRSVLIDHGDGLYSLYAHLGKVMIEEGEDVELETVLAEIGLTGRTTGYHLHLEIVNQGVAVNPARFLSAVVRLANKN